MENKMKTVKILAVEQSERVFGLRHYTLLYRGREYIKSLYETSGKYEVNDIVIVDTHRDVRGYLCFMLCGIVK